MKGPEHVPSCLPAEDLLPLVLDVWRLTQLRAEEGQVSCLTTRIYERLNSLGYRLETPDGSYDENARVKVVEHQPGPEPRRIIACLTPAIYWHGQLVKEANVITKGKS